MRNVPGEIEFTRVGESSTARVGTPASSARLPAAVFDPPGRARGAAPAGERGVGTPGRVGRAPSAPAPGSGHAVMRGAARVSAEFGGRGLGRVRMPGAAQDVMRRGVRAIEAFGYLGDPDSPKAACVIPARFLTAVGFKTVREHRSYPRLRLDLRTALTWRVDMEAAVERLLAAVRSPSLSPGRPASDARAMQPRQATDPTGG